MSNVNLSDFQQLYLQTAKEHLVSMRQSIETLSQNTTDTSAIETLHRSAHSLKSESMVMKYESTGEVSLLIESIFRKIQDGEKNVDPSLLEHLSSVLSSLEQSLDQIELKGEETDLSETVSFLKKEIE